MDGSRVRSVIIASVVALAGIALAPADPAAERQALAPRLETIRAEAKLPALAGATFRSSGSPDIAAVGVRRLGDSTKVTTDDLWHVGSLTKSFTATLVGLFIERGQLSWTSTLGELLGPERARQYAAVTLLDLLTHRSGLPGNVPGMFAYRLSTAPVTEQRQRVIDALLSVQPASKPGEKFQYSNGGYVVLGAMLEARTGRPWEDLLRTEVLNPLALRSAGFGAPGAKDLLTQPRGHGGNPGSLTPVEPGPMADNPAFLGPAGTLHLSMADVVRWGQAHLRGERGTDGLLRAATFRRLHQPPVAGADYACGWVVQRDGARRIVWHNGSNTMWYIILAFDPDADRGVALATNGGIGAANSLNAAAFGLLKELAATPPQ